MSTPLPARKLASRGLGAFVALLACAPAVAAPRVLVYRWPTGQTLCYKIAANVNGKLPLFESKEPVELEATIGLVYSASAKARTPEGNYPVSFRVLSADAEVAKIPFDVPKDQARKLLDQRVTLKPSGEVVKLEKSPPLPFSVSIPGIDLKQLHTLIVPIVFPGAALKAGDTWTFQSALLGKDGASPYKATLVSIGAAPASKSGAATTIATIRTEFSMDIDQKLGKDKKPAANPDDVVRTRKGTVVGTGTFRFDASRGRLSRGEVKIKAQIGEDVVGPLESPDDPRHVDSVVSADITVEPTAPEKAPAPSAKTKSASSPSKRK